jgi:tRNA nucleotidyltransferase/poly(A) polymerase
MGVIFDMNKTLKEILNTLNKNGFEAYIVGGYVRDFLLGYESNDYDICTNAKMQDLIKLFSGNVNKYGSLNIKLNDGNIDITTYRKESNYENRRPTSISYTSLLDEDLLRRDFTINTICMDKEGKIIDKLNGLEDLNNKVIRMVLDEDSKIIDDPLRILRAIRFATLLNFKIDKKLEVSICKNASLIKNLSGYRIKEELSKILLSKNFRYGLDLMNKYGLTSYLGITYDNIVYIPDLCGMWAQINLNRDLPFTKNEKRTILKIQEIVKHGVINNELLYENGLYLCLIAGRIIGIFSSDIYQMYQNLPIKAKNELNIKSNDIIDILNLIHPKKVKDIENIIIKNILNGNLLNEYNAIKKFLVENKERWVSNE